MYTLINTEFENEIAKEGAKAVVSLVKDAAEDLVRPTTRSIGNNIGLAIEGAFGWLGNWGEKQKFLQELNYIDFTCKIREKINLISDSNLKEPQMNIAGPAIESSKHFYEEEHYREMFSNLISASCDKSKQGVIHPAFVEIIKQLSPLDAKLLSLFKIHHT